MLIEFVLLSEHVMLLNVSDIIYLISSSSSILQA